MRSTEDIVGSCGRACKMTSLKRLKPSLEELQWILGGEWTENKDPDYVQAARTRQEVEKPRHKGPRSAPLKLHDTTTGDIVFLETLSEGQSYATVSHVWAETAHLDWSKIAIEIGDRLGINFLWVDRTCIDQNDLDEMNEEIPKMTRYYRDADLNVIALGNMDMAVAVNEWIGQGRPLAGEGCQKAALQKLVELLSCPHVVERKTTYFERVWTLQEFDLARYHVVLAGDGLIEGEDLDMLLRSIYDVGERVTMHFFNNTAERADHDDELWDQQMRRPLLEVWERAKGRRCTEPKDILWGVLSLVAGGENLAAKYSDPLHEVLAELLQVKPNMPADILAIKETSALRCWFPSVKDGEIPRLGCDISYGGFEMFANGTPFPSVLKDGMIETEAFELSWPEHPASDMNSPEDFRLNEEVKFKMPKVLASLRLYPAIRRGDPIFLRARRFWGVPLRRLEHGLVAGVVVADENSRGSKVHKVACCGDYYLQARAFARVHMTTIQVGNIPMHT